MAKEKSKWLAKGVEYYPESGTLLLIRCPKCGRENWAPPTLIDTDRTRRGDYMKKPTAYWFWNCEPTVGYSYQQTPKGKQRRHMDMRKAPHAGLCSEERSTISPDYARNFICDFIIGKEQAHTQPLLFDL